MNLLELEVFINSFEAALIETQKYKENLEASIQDKQKALFSDDSQLSRDSIRLLTAFERESSLFEALEKRFDQVGTAAIRAGQQIERASLERRRALEAKEIIQSFIEFTSAPELSASKLESAILGGASLDARLKAAERLKRLQSVAKALPTGSEAILNLSQRVENGLLAQFHAAFDVVDMLSMRSSAALLVSFNGGHSCVQSFVNQHEFFQTPADAAIVVSKYKDKALPLDFSIPEQVDSAIVGVFGQIVATSEEDWKYLQEVFDSPSLVMDTLLTRIFHEPVQVCLEATLHQAKQHSLQAYLRALYASHKAAGELVKALCRVYEKFAADPEAQSARLNDLVAGLFSPFLEPRGYIQVEVQAISHLIHLATGPLLIASKQRKQSRATMAFLRPATPVQINLSEAGLYRFADGNLVTEKEGADLVPSVAVVRRCLIVHAESVVRAYTLLNEHDCGAALEPLLNTLLTGILQDYVSLALDTHIETGDFGIDSKLGYDRVHFEATAAAGQILTALQTYFQSAILPVAVTVSPTTYRQMVLHKTEQFNLVVERINSLLRRQIQGNLAWIDENLLSKQRRSDFKPKGDDLAALAGVSQACSCTCRFLREVAQSVNHILEKENARLYLTELGNGFHSLLLDHIRRYSVSDMGALLLRNDLRAYKDAITESFGPAVSTIQPSFELLCELGNIFLVRPENLRSILQEGLLAQLDTRFTAQFIAQRTDFKSARLDTLFPEINSSSLSSFFALTAADL